MACNVSKKAGSMFLMAALVVILVSGGTLAACSKSQTTTSAPASTTASTSTRTTTSAPSTTTTSAQTTTTRTSAPTSTGVSAADFYKANLLTVQVTTGAGGGTDYAGRLFAQFWPEVTGGRAVVLNESAGGGVVGVNRVYAAKGDGLMIGVSMLESNLITPVLAGNPGVAFDTKKMSWLGWMNRIGIDTMGVGPKSPCATIQDVMKTTGFKFATSGRTASGAWSAGMIIDYLGLKNAGIVAGYGGSSEVALAVARGEVDAYNMNWFNMLDNIAKGIAMKTVLLLDTNRPSYIPASVPLITEVVKLSQQQMDLLTMSVSLNSSGQIFWTPPNVPQDRIDFLRSAFDKITVMDSFLKLAVLRWPQQVPAISGKSLAGEMQQILAVATPEKVKELQALADKYIR